MPGCRERAGPGALLALRRFHLACLARHGGSMGAEQRKALQSILTCRTEAMGGRSYRCDHCARDHFAWHSCNHRLCPVCGSAGNADWVAGRLAERLPVEHFMVTFTLPSQLREVCRAAPRPFLKAFFAASSQAVKDVLRERRHLGGECGFFGMLQTWTQDLRLHPHIHYVVPAVGIGPGGKARRPRKAGWLARGEVFAARLRTLLLKALVAEGLATEAQAAPLWEIGWNCDVESFGSGENAIKYLGAYVCKGPISDSRILAVGERTVTVSVKDRASGELGSVEIEGAEFVRRYLQHALPAGFHRLRYYGFLHARARGRLEALRALLGAVRPVKAPPAPRPEPKPALCPRCGAAMRLVACRSRAPPHLRTIPALWNRKSAA